MFGDESKSNKQIAEVEKQVDLISSTLKELFEFIKPAKTEEEPWGWKEEDKEQSDKEEENGNTDPTAEKAQGKLQNLKMDFKVQIPMYLGVLPLK